MFSFGGPGEIRTPDHAASKGVSACKADVLTGGLPLTRLNYRPMRRNRRVSLGRLRFRSRLLNLVIHGSLTFYRANREFSFWAFCMAGKEPLVYIDGEYHPKGSAKISVYDHGLLYGD